MPKRPNRSAVAPAQPASATVTPTHGREPEEEAYCALCFRVLLQRWTTSRTETIKSLVRADDAPYADIVCLELERLSRRVRLIGNRNDVVAVCDYCASFLKERTFASSGDVRRGRKHGMQLAIEHVLSGGSLPAPSRPHFLRCLAILERSGHLFRTIRNGELHDRIEARKRLGGNDCAVRWLFEGRQRIFGDPVLAKNLRRWINARAGGRRKQAMMRTTTMDATSTDVATTPPPRRVDIGAVWELPSPCRFCLHAPNVLATPSYRNALCFDGGSVESVLQMIEHAIEPGLTHFCIHCSRISVISFEYMHALRRLMELPMCDGSADGYYACLIARSNAWRTHSSRPPPRALQMHGE